MKADHLEVLGNYRASQKSQFSLVALDQEEIEVLSDLLIARLQELRKVSASLPIRHQKALHPHIDFLMELHKKILKEV